MGLEILAEEILDQKIYEQFLKLNIYHIFHTIF